MEQEIYNQFLTLLQAKNYKQINVFYKLYSDNINIKFEYAKWLVKNKKTDQAKKLFSELLNTKLKKESILELGRIEKKIGNIESARKHFIELIGTRNNNCAILELGKLEKSLGNVEDAKKYFTELLNSSNKEYAMLELGKLEKESGNVDLARKYFTELLVTKNKEYAMLELGKLEKELGNIEYARSCFNQLLDENNRKYGLLELAILESEEGNFMISKNYFEELLTIEKKKETYNLLILSEIKAQNYINALKYINYGLKNKIRINPSFILYISKKLNIFFDINYEDIKYDYYLNQIVNYESNVSKKYITNSDIYKQLNLSQGININGLFNNIKLKLTSENKMKVLQFNDVYVVPFNKFNGNQKGYLLVKTLPNTQDIITIYPLPSKKKANIYLRKYESIESKMLKR